MEAEIGCGSGKFLWKRNLEAVKGFASTSTLAFDIERQKFECGTIFLQNIRQKLSILSISICKETFLKACGSLRSVEDPTPINAKMNHVANQLIFKIKDFKNSLF